MYHALLTFIIFGGFKVFLLCMIVVKFPLCFFKTILFLRSICRERKVVGFVNFCIGGARIFADVGSVGAEPRA